MDQETFNLSIRKFLKMVGVNSQREMEQAVQRSAAKLAGTTGFPVKVTLEIPSLGVKVPFEYPAPAARPTGASGVPGAVRFRPLTPMRMFSVTLWRKMMGSWRTTPIWRRRSAVARRRIGSSSSRISP